MYKILSNFSGFSAGYPNAIMPVGLACTGNPRILETLLSSNAPTKLAPIISSIEIITA